MVLAFDTKQCQIFDTEQGSVFQSDSVQQKLYAQLFTYLHTALSHTVHIQAANFLGELFLLPPTPFVVIPTLRLLKRAEKFLEEKNPSHLGCSFYGF